MTAECHQARVQTLSRPDPTATSDTSYVPHGWEPRFADYLSLAFWTATAFSPADVSAIKRWAKLLMITEAMVSLLIGLLVIACAINILG